MELQICIWPKLTYFHLKKSDVQQLKEEKLPNSSILDLFSYEYQDTVINWKTLGITHDVLGASSLEQKAFLQIK